MKIKKIDIQTPNKKHATDITMIVDKIEFLRELQKLREKWAINELYKPGDFYSFFATSIELKGRVSEFNRDIDALLKKFHRGRNFKQVVENAMVTGAVPDGIYQSCYFDVVTIGESEDLNKPERYQYVIVMSPRTEEKEVRQAYKEFLAHIIGQEATNEFETDVVGKINFLKRAQNLDIENPNDRDLIEQYHKGNVYRAADIKKFKTKPDLDRIREWFWIRNEKFFNGEASKPLPYPEVLDKWLDTCPFYKENKPHPLGDPECPKCTFEIKKIRTDKKVKEGGGSFNHIEKALDKYSELLNNS